MMLDASCDGCPLRTVLASWPSGSMLCRPKAGESSAARDNTRHPHRSQVTVAQTPTHAQFQVRHSLRQLLRVASTAEHHAMSRQLCSLALSLILVLGPAGRVSAQEQEARAASQDTQTESAVCAASLLQALLHIDAALPCRGQAVQGTDKELGARVKTGHLRCAAAHTARLRATMRVILALGDSCGLQHRRSQQQTSLRACLLVPVLSQGWLFPILRYGPNNQVRTFEPSLPLPTLHPLHGSLWHSRAACLHRYTEQSARTAKPLQPSL